MIPQWVVNEVADGLAGLLALRLKNAPGEDMVDLTASIWEQAIGQQASVEQLDAHRIREGFRRIFPRVREWPAPRDVIELMPCRPPVPRLPAPELSDEEHRANVARVREMMAELETRLYGTLKNYGKQMKGSAGGDRQ